MHEIAESLAWLRGLGQAIAASGGEVRRAQIRGDFPAGCRLLARRRRCESFRGGEFRQPSPTAPTPARDGLRGDEPANSASAEEARKLVQQYFDQVTARKFDQAYKLWGHGGADAGGTQKAFAASFDAYERYQPKVGEPTEIKRSGMLQYVSVMVEIDVVLKRGHRVRKLSGPVMLRRSADPKTADADARDWRIWGTDTRVRH